MLDGALPRYLPSSWLTVSRITFVCLCVWSALLLPSGATTRMSESASVTKKMNAPRQHLGWRDDLGFLCNLRFAFFLCCLDLFNGTHHHETHKIRTEYNMSDIAAFCFVVALATVAARRQQKRLFWVDKDNEPLLSAVSTPSTEQNKEAWQRAVYILIMHDPPEMFYEPKEWNHTSVLLCKTKIHRRQRQADDDHDDDDELLVLPSGLLWHPESYVHCASRVLHNMSIDVSQPENSLHHLFTFPLTKERQDNNGTNSKNQQLRPNKWCDFMECVYRGALDPRSHHQQFIRASLGELKDMVISHSQSDHDQKSECIFTTDTYYALRLYFQRQGDLRAKRRLLKSYSSSDLQHYQLRSLLPTKIVFRDDDHDTQRSEAVDYTMQTDDGMSPSLLLQADVVLLGVSRAGKTPVSLLLSQTMGFKVANIPLVVDIAPPPQLFQISPKRVFLLTVDETQLRTFRRNRLRRELQQHKKAKAKTVAKSSYADTDYIRRDLEHATALARRHGFTEIKVSGRAIEETASLIASKIKERFPETDVGVHGVVDA